MNETDAPHKVTSLVLRVTWQLKTNRDEGKGDGQESNEAAFLIFHMLFEVAVHFPDPLISLVRRRQVPI